MLELVRIDENYVNFLRKVDSRVQSNVSALGKDTKPFLGALFRLKDSNLRYFVPFSSPKEKHKNMKNTTTFHKVVDKKGKLRAVLNFNNMIPAPLEVCVRIDLKTDKDRFVLMDEYVFCKDNEEELIKKAKNLYLRSKRNELLEKEKQITCDFSLLEKSMLEYIKSQSSASSEVATTSTSVEQQQNPAPTNVQKAVDNVTWVEIEPLDVYKNVGGGVIVRLSGKNPEDTKRQVLLQKNEFLLDKYNKVCSVSASAQARFGIPLKNNTIKKLKT